MILVQFLVNKDLKCNLNKSWFQKTYSSPTTFSFRSIYGKVKECFAKCAECFAFVLLSFLYHFYIVCYNSTNTASSLIFSFSFTHKPTQYSYFLNNHTFNIGTQTTSLSLILSFILLHACHQLRILKPFSNRYHLCSLCSPIHIN